MLEYDVIMAVSEQLEIDALSVMLGSHFVNDLSVDRLDKLLIFRKLEDKYNLRISNKEFEKAAYAWDVVTSIRKIQGNTKGQEKDSNYLDSASFI